MFKSLTNIFKKKGSSSSASPTGVGGQNEKKSFLSKLIAKVSTGIIDSLSKYSVQQEEVVGVDISPNWCSIAAALTDRTRRVGC
jgi:hypothetical protein